MDVTLDKLEAIGEQLAASRDHADANRETAKQAAIIAHKAGLPETRIAVALRVDRLTVRRWLGK